MSEDYTGVCRSKNWAWKRLKSMNRSFQDLKVGCSTCTLSTKAQEGFDSNVEAPAGIKGSVSGSEATYYTVWAEDRKVNIARFEALKTFAESFKQADSAVLVSRKSSSQVQVLKCGSK